jgi:hypothetical protein
MERLNAPFTVYVTTGMITRTIDAWWFGLAALVRARHQIERSATLPRPACQKPSAPSAMASSGPTASPRRFKSSSSSRRYWP